MYLKMNVLTCSRYCRGSVICQDMGVSKGNSMSNQKTLITHGCPNYDPIEPSRSSCKWSLSCHILQKVFYTLLNVTVDRW